MNRRSFAWIAGLAAAAWLGGVALAAQERPGPPPHGMGPQLAKALGLSEEQQAAVEALHREQGEAMKPLMEQQRQLHEAFQAALEAESPDPAEVGRKALAMHAGMKKVEAAHAALHEKLVALLDAGQKEKLKALEESGLMPGPGRHGFGPGPGGPMGRMGHHPPPPPDAPQE